MDVFQIAALTGGILAVSLFIILSTHFLFNTGKTFLGTPFSLDEPGRVDCAALSLH